MKIAKKILMSLFAVALSAGICTTAHKVLADSSTYVIAVDTPIDVKPGDTLDFTSLKNYDTARFSYLFDYGSTSSTKLGDGLDSWVVPEHDGAKKYSAKCTSPVTGFYIITLTHEHVFDENGERCLACGFVDGNKLGDGSVLFAGTKVSLVNYEGHEDVLNWDIKYVYDGTTQTDTMNTYTYEITVREYSKYNVWDLDLDFSQKNIGTIGITLTPHVHKNLVNSKCPACGRIDASTIKTNDAFYAGAILDFKTIENYDQKTFDIQYKNDGQTKTASFDSHGELVLEENWEIDCWDVCPVPSEPYLFYFYKHTHTIEKHNKKDATCSDFGLKEYYQCKGCKECYTDKDGKNHIEDFSKWSKQANLGLIEKTSHSYENARCKTCGLVNGNSLGNGSTLFANEIVTVVNFEGYNLIGDWNIIYTNANGDTIGNSTVDKSTYTVAVEEVSEISKWDIYFNKENVPASVDVTLKPHTHSISKQTGTAASCTSTGLKDYYVCSKCNEAFEDENGNTSISDLATWKVTSGKGLIPALGHDYSSLQEGKAPSCTENGYKDYYKCSRCTALAEDTDGDTIIANLETWKVTADAGLLTKLGHDYSSKQDRKAPSCTENGYEAYYKCSRCDACAEDADGDTPISNIDTWKTTDGQGLIKATGHNLAIVGSGTPKCLLDGWKQSYICQTCNARFADSKGTTPIANYDTWKTTEGQGLVKATGHHLVLVNQVDPSCSEYGVLAYYHCDKCNTFDFTDSEGKNRIDFLAAWKAGDGRINKLPHTYSEVTYTWDKKTKSCTAYCDCDECGYHLEETIAGQKVKGTTYEAVFVNDELGASTQKFGNPLLVVLIVVLALLLVLVVLYILWKFVGLELPLVGKACLTPLFRIINNLLFKTELNDIELKEKNNADKKEAKKAEAN